MNLFTRFLRWVGLVLLALPSISVGQTEPAAADVQGECALIAETRRAAAVENDAAIETRLLSAVGLARKESPGVLLARRAAAVCGWLRNDNEYGRAMKLAQRVIARLAFIQESNDADHVERLYWEAQLEGEILDHKARALALLQEGERLAPNDPRFLEGELRWAQALAEFGR